MGTIWHCLQGYYLCRYATKPPQKVSFCGGLAKTRCFACQILLLQIQERCALAGSDNPVES